VTKRLCLAAALALAVLAFTRAAQAAEADDPGHVAVMPGDARVISHSTSASRDVGALSYQVLPCVALGTGGDFAFLGFHFAGLELRAGMFGLIEVETREPQPASFMNVPAGTYLWRGSLGYSLALSLGEVGERLVGPGGQLEIALSFRHESEHYTGTREGGAPLYPDVPNIGDFFMPDLAVRKALGPFDLELRAQIKAFLPSSAYSAGPGADVVLRWRALPLLHPFVSFFVERLFGRYMEWGDGGRQIPDNTLLRGLVGVIVPGEAADLMLYCAMSSGNGKGLLAYGEYREIGWGIRVAFLKRSPFRDERGRGSGGAVAAP
jgi:hypothetical protein